MTDEKIEKLDPSRSRGQLLIDAYRAERTLRRGARQTMVEQLRATLRAGRPHLAGPTVATPALDLGCTPKAAPSPPAMADALAAPAGKSVFAHLLDTPASIPNPDASQPEALDTVAGAPDGPDPPVGEAAMPEPEPASLLLSPDGLSPEIAAVPEAVAPAEAEHEPAVPALSEAIEPTAMQAAPEPAAAAVSADETPPHAEATTSPDVEQMPPVPPAETSALVGLAGFGPGMTLRLSQLGYHTAADLADADPAQLRQALGTISSLLDVDAWIENARRHRGTA